MKKRINRLIQTSRILIMKRYIFCICIIFILVSCENKTEHNFYIEIGDGSGINQETEILYRGQKIGKVYKLFFVKDNLIAEVLVSKEFSIYSDTEFYVVTTDILGTKAIVVVNPGKGQLFLPTKNDTISSQNRPSQFELLLKEVFDKTKAIIDTVKEN